MDDLNNDLRKLEKRRKAEGDNTPVLFLCKQEQCRQHGPTVIRKTTGHGTCRRCHKYNKL